MGKESKIKGNISLNTLMRLLNSAIKNESQNWKPIFYSRPNENEDDVGFLERNSKVDWILEVNEYFKCNPETVVLAIAIFDYFMSVVKVKAKYTQCIAVTCYFLAMKTMEEDEVIPTTAELVEGTKCACAASDILRMEKIILQKLNWNTKLTSTVDFLHTMHGLLLLNHTSLTWSPGRQLSSMTQKLNTCLTNHRLLAFKPSTVALALLSLELQYCTRDWLALTIMMQSLIKLNNEDLIHCREVISEILSMKISYVQRKLSGKRHLSPVNKPSKRKVEEVEEDDDIYDSIKRLYSNELQSSSCSTQAENLSRVAHITSPTCLEISAL